MKGQTEAIAVPCMLTWSVIVMKCGLSQAIELHSACYENVMWMDCRAGWQVCRCQRRSDKEEEVNVAATESVCNGCILVSTHDDQVRGRWKSDGRRAGRAQWHCRRWEWDEGGGWREPITVVVCAAHVRNATRQSVHFSSFTSVHLIQVLTDEWGLNSAMHCQYTIYTDVGCRYSTLRLWCTNHLHYLIC